MQLLSDAAGDLLAALMARACLPIGAGPDDVLPDDPALEELLECGLAAVSGSRVMPVAPATTLTDLLARKQRELMDGHRRLLLEYERLMEHTVVPASTQIELLPCETDVMAVLHALQAEVTGEFSAIDMPPLVASARPEPAHRLIYTKELLSRGGLVILDGWQYRLISELPLRMALSQHVALIMISSSGQAAAVVRVPAVITALRHYFDLLWCQATRLDGDEGRQVTRVQRLILGMLLSGLGDDTIARSLNVSTRSVRRHVASLEQRAGVSCRFALGAAAVRLGWVDAG